MGVRVAVVIPFRGDAGLLRWTLEGYARQRLPEGVELDVLVGGDGCAVQIGGVKGAGRVRILTRELARMGAAGVRNELVKGAEAAGAEVIIFGNADARPEEEMVAVHVKTLRGLPEGGKGAMVLGAAPWDVPEEGKTVFDALLAQTPMVFFYNSLRAGEWYDFRHAWTLNLSMRTEDFAKAKGLEAKIRPVYYEDLVLGFRVMGAKRAGVFYEPRTRVVHRHPTTLEQYLNREELLGLMSPVLAKYAPEVFAAIHGKANVRTMALECLAWVRMDRTMHQWIYMRMAEWAGQPVAALGEGAEAERMLQTIYQMHVPLKRLAFRLGFLRGLEMVNDKVWEKRSPVGMWREVVGEKSV